MVTYVSSNKELNGAVFGFEAKAGVIELPEDVADTIAPLLIKYYGCKLKTSRKTKAT